MAHGLFEANLGGDLLKKADRVVGSMENRGYRTLVVTNPGIRWIIAFRFLKARTATLIQMERRR